MDANEKMFIASAMSVLTLFLEPEKDELKTLNCLILYITILYRITKE
jgi:hypothetical protein